MSLNLPEDFKKKYERLFGSRYKYFENSLFKEPIEGFRLNPLKEDYENVQVNVDSKVDYSDIGYYGKINGNSIDHISGYLYSQDPSAMYVAEVLNPKPGEKILDLCAAPGSKTTHIASKMNNKGILVANEINTPRAKILSSNIERMGVTNAVVLNNRPDQLLSSFTGYFDKIVVDAPCSGEGMFRKDHEAVNYWSLDYVKACAKRQKEILAVAFELLRPGGEMVYSTCTFSAEEDEQNALWLADNFNMEIIAIDKYEGMEEGIPAWCNNDNRAKSFLRMFPDSFKGEGHFISKFKKNEEDLNFKFQKSKNKNIEKKSKELFDVFCNDNLNTSFEGIQQHGLTLEKPIIDTSTLNNELKILRNGLRLGELKKNRFEPNHSLVLSLSSNQIKNVLELSENEYTKYIHGETIKINDNLSSQWIGVSYKKKIFSWGKIANNTIKNFYPKGLRQ